MSVAGPGAQVVVGRPAPAAALVCSTYLVAPDPVSPWIVPALFTGCGLAMILDLVDALVRGRDVAEVPGIATGVAIESCAQQPVRGRNGLTPFPTSR